MQAPHGHVLVTAAGGRVAGWHRDAAAMVETRFRGAPLLICSTPPPPVKSVSGVPAGWPTPTLDWQVPGVICGSYGITPPCGSPGW